MTKETITWMKRDTTDKEGNPLVSKKTGRPYTRLTIKAESRGDKYLSGFENAATKDWKVGDAVDIEITENGQYLNFSVPKVADSKVTENTEAILNRLVTMNIKLDQILEVVKPKKSVSFKTPENTTAFDEPEEEMEQPF